MRTGKGIAGVTAMLLALACVAPARGQPGEGAPAPRAGHPVIGLWRLDLPAFTCHETYRIRADGTTSVASAGERAESRFTIADRPSAAGFYRWVDRTTSTNGAPDCAGQFSPVGEEVVRYLIFDRSATHFLLCEQEDLQTCIGPFERIREALI